jgi:hypothetical protein
VYHCVAAVVVAVVAVVVVPLFLPLGCFLTILTFTAFWLLLLLSVVVTMLLLFSTVRFLSAPVLRVIHTYIASNKSSEVHDQPRVHIKYTQFTNDLITAYAYLLLCLYTVLHNTRVY